MTRIYLVAVHDSSLFTLCPPELRAALASGDFQRLRNLPNRSAGNFGFKGNRIWLQPDGKLLVSFGAGARRRSLSLPPGFLPEGRGILERARPDWQELSGMVAGICPSGWLDSGMQKEIEAEFKSKKDYELVDSAEKADFVLLVEGLYYTYWEPESGLVRNYFGIETGPLFGRHMRQAAIAVLIPSEVYRRDPTDCGAFLQAGLWAGMSVWQGVEFAAEPWLSTRSASIKELMSQFFKRAKWDADLPPIYPAWSTRPGGVPDTVSGKRALSIASDSGKPLPSAEETRPVPSANVIRAETVLVTVPVIVSDVNGRYVPGLTVNEFHLYEDGIEQKIDRLIDESAPFHTALLMDVSHGTAMVRADIERAALKLMESLRPEDEVMALSISNVIYVDFEFSRDRSRLQSAITKSAPRATSPYKQQWDNTNLMGTRLYDALDLSVTERLNKVSGRKAILFFTDGIDTGSRLASAPSTLARIEESDVLVYVVKYDTPMPKTRFPDAKAGAAAAQAQAAQYLETLAANSGGRLFHASKGADLQAAFAHIAEELRHQYTLCYYPAGPLKDGSFRGIQVTVDRAGVKVRARPGYRVIR